MSPLGMAEREGLDLLDFVKDVAKANIGPMNVDQQKIDKASQYYWETPWEASRSPPQVKHDPVIPSHCGGHVTPGKLKNPLPAVKKTNKQTKNLILFWKME